MNFREALARRVLVFDGAMGTQIQGHALKAVEFGGREGANDLLTLTRPELVRQIHERYFAVGCDVVETNTFGSSRLKLDEYGLGHRTYEVNFRAALNARQAADRFSTPERPRFVAGSIGPTGMLPSSTDPALSNITPDALERIFYEQARGLVDGGCDAIIIETQQDILELRAAVLAVDAYRRESLKDVFVIAQPTLIDQNGRMLLGTDVASALATLERLPCDAVGLNCSTGPDEMRESVRYLGEHSSKPVSVLPNAGIPENVNGQAVYRLSPERLAASLREFVEAFGVEIVGGCCGTTPEHLRAVVEAIAPVAERRRRRPAKPAPEVSSGMKAVPLDLKPPPLIVGERVNAQGSRKVKELLLANDYQGVLQIARGQVEGGAHVLDVCVALNERDDEVAQMRHLVRLLAQGVDAPLMIDSTEADVIEAALKAYPGRAIVNSVNLEKSGERVKKVLPLVKRYGAAVVCMTIDEKGMALSAERKAQIAQRMVAVAKEHGIEPDCLVFDPLTFTLATGGAEYRHSAVETIEGLRRIKAENPGVFTCLGVSNVSFGLSRPAREVLNSVFLYHAAKAGLDLAIVNPKDVKPYPAIAAAERELAEDLLFDRRDDALPRLVERFASAGSGGGAAAPLDDLFAGKTAEERIHLQILHRKPDGLEALIDDALTRRSAVQVLNEVLLPAMKDVGDRFGSGELILPFVLQSAEVMKKAVAHLERFMEKVEGTTKGTVVLATVYGDVHDIGKNLVKTILVNNGYAVHDLGKQVPVASIIEKAVAVNADAIGLSALLVSTSKQMPYCVQELARRNLSFPVVIGGAAINRKFGFRAHFLEDGAPYPGGVFYAKDAFEGLAHVEALASRERRDAHREANLARALANRNAPQMEPAPAPAAPGRRSAVAPVEKPPTPPFWGTRVVPAGEIPLAELWPLLDLPELFKLQWGVRSKDKAEYERLVRDEFGPRLEQLKAEIAAKGWLTPRVVYGYFPCHADGDALVVLDPGGGRAEVARFDFPRQPDESFLCLADYFRPEPGSDVVAFQVVTVGDQASELAHRFQEQGDYTKSLFLHGLAVETAEALAERWHRRVREELGLPAGQGKRYSPGYPAWPELDDQAKVWRLLDPARAIGVTLTEAFQMVPEQSTSAVVLHHPGAVYYSVRGASPVKAAGGAR